MHIDFPSVGHRLRATLWALCALGIADVIAVEGDPLADVTSLERAKFVAKGGKIYLPP